MDLPVLTGACHFCVLLTEFPNPYATEPWLAGVVTGVCNKKGFTRFYVYIICNTLISDKFGQQHLSLSSHVSPSPAHHAHRKMLKVVRSQAREQQVWAAKQTHLATESSRRNCHQANLLPNSQLMESYLPRVCGSFLRECRVLTAHTRRADAHTPRWLERQLGAPYPLITFAEILLMKLAGLVTVATCSDVSLVVEEPASTPLVPTSAQATRQGARAQPPPRPSSKPQGGCGITGLVYK